MVWALRFKYKKYTITFGQNPLNKIKNKVSVIKINEYINRIEKNKYLYVSTTSIHIYECINRSNVTR